MPPPNREAPGGEGKKRKGLKADMTFRWRNEGTEENEERA